MRRHQLDPACGSRCTQVIWALDFQFDSTVNGKAIKIASMIDEHTRLSVDGCEID
jgi:putative transposase